MNVLSAFHLPHTHTHLMVSCHNTSPLTTEIFVSHIRSTSLLAIQSTEERQSVRLCVEFNPRRLHIYVYILFHPSEYLVSFHKRSLKHHEKRYTCRSIRISTPHAFSCENITPIYVTYVFLDETNHDII
jgi:hypothetical protein